MFTNSYYQEFAVKERIHARHHEANLARAARAGAPRKQSRHARPDVRLVLAAVSHRLQALFAKASAHAAAG